MAEQPRSEFEKQASEHGEGNLLSDFWLFVRDNKKWWLIPLLLVLLLLGALMMLTGTGAAPFIYTLF